MLDFRNSDARAAAAVRILRWIIAIVVACSGPAYAAGNFIEYTFDPAGNITGIDRPGAASLSITGFSPASGPIGTAVTIAGTGFSATPGNNAVTFNGIAASVSSSSSGSIATTVPTGSTTGPISVTVGGVTVTSSATFTVTAAGSPTITSFTPTSGAASTSVAVTGTNFVTGATTVALNGVSATASATSTTALTFAVPSAVSSGRISATTSSGTGTSATDFIVPPPGLTTGNIESAVRITADAGYQSVSVTTAGKTALVLFDAAANTYYSLQLGAFTTSPINTGVTYKVLAPNNSVVMSGQVVSNNIPTLHLPLLSSAGTYTLQLTPTGMAVLNVNVRLDTNPAIVVDGASVSFAQDNVTESSRFTFAASAGQRLGLGCIGLTNSPIGSGTSMTVRKPDGSNLSGGNCPVGTGGFDILTTVAGTYTITVDSGGGVKTGGALQLTSDATGTLSADAGQTVTLARTGQSATYTFSASTGDSFGVDVSAASLGVSFPQIFLNIYKPDGSQLCQTSSQTNAYCELGTLATAGTYTVHLRAYNGLSGTAVLTLKQGPLIGTSDAPAAFSSAHINETARVRFTAASGANIGVGVSNFAYVGSGGYSSLVLYNPSASNIGSNNCAPDVNSGTCQAQAKNTVSGTYSAVIVPSNGVKISGNIQVSDDLTGTFTTGTAQSLNITRVGQAAIYTYAGNAGDTLFLKIYSVTTTPANQAVNVELDRPDTSYVGGTSGTTTSPGLGYFSALPVTGNYRVIVSSPAGYPWSGTIKFDAGTAVSVNGTPASLATSAPGEPLAYLFTGTAGQELDLGYAGLAYGSGSGTTGLTWVLPSGYSFPGIDCNPSGGGNCDTVYAALPATGTYALVLRPPYNASITGGTLTLSTPATGTFNVGDPAQVVAIARSGQRAAYTFSGTSGQLLHLNWSSTTVSGSSSVAVSVLNPNGSTLSSNSFVDSATGGFDIASLPSTGTYTVLFDPANAATMSATVSLVTR